MKGIFDTKDSSGYDDDIARRYHFPSRYRADAEQMVGDWIIYREPRRNDGREAYVAVGKVLQISSDPTRPGHFYAVIGDYLRFDRPVPFYMGRYAEAALRELERRDVGRYLQGRSIRSVSRQDFAAIVRAGLSETLAPEHAVKLGLDHAHIDPDTLALMHAPLEEQERQIEKILLNRKIRDASFRGQVCKAYDDTCAVTGLKIVNGGGKSEVQAAHIWPVASGGPDVVQNGIALSATVHWLFDRHLISLTDDYRLLVSHNRVPAELRGLFASQMEGIRRPADNNLWPHPAYIKRHREAFSAA